MTKPESYLGLFHLKKKITLTIPIFEWPFRLPKWHNTQSLKEANVLLIIDIY